MSASGIEKVAGTKKVPLWIPCRHLTVTKQKSPTCRTRWTLEYWQVLDDSDQITTSRRRGSNFSNTREAAQGRPRAPRQQLLVRSTPLWLRERSKPLLPREHNKQS